MYPVQPVVVFCGHYYYYNYQQGEYDSHIVLN
jgi:hypothetical protein